MRGPPDCSTSTRIVGTIGRPGVPQVVGGQSGQQNLRNRRPPCSHVASIQSSPVEHSLVVEQLGRVSQSVETFCWIQHEAPSTLGMHLHPLGH